MRNKAMIDEALFAKIPTLKILVVGDVMLDEYLFGDVSRISPEAPVPICKVERREARPGGAANVARNVAAMGAQVQLLSLVGDDDAADVLSHLLHAEDVPHHFQIDKTSRTISKQRVIGRQQQMLRIDIEEAFSDAARTEITAAFTTLLQDAQLVIFSDYAKGVLKNIASYIALAQAKNIPCLVDPKGRSYGKYAHATLLTPNRSELMEAVGGWEDENEMNLKAQQLRAQLGLKALLVTLSEQGMRLFMDGDMLHQLSLAREVYDVSGAGDTVLAALAVMMGVGASWHEAIYFANSAAGVAVSKLGTAVVSLEETLAAMQQTDRA
jgi:D-glycero-beta-D-manno-heptose-7-phosphate kinase